MYSFFLKKKYRCSIEAIHLNNFLNRNLTRSALEHEFSHFPRFILDTYCKIGSVTQKSVLFQPQVSWIKMPRLAQITRLLSTNSYDRVRPVLSLQDLWTLHVSGIKHKNKGPYSCTMSTSLSRLGDKVWMDWKYMIKGIFSQFVNLTIWYKEYFWDLFQD